MPNQDIQDLVDARMNSVKDQYVDDGALLKLRHVLLHETRANHVSVERVGDNELHAIVNVNGDIHEGHVKLSQFVPRLHDVVVPAHVEFHNNLPQDQKDATHEERADKRKQEADKAAAEHDEAAHDEVAHDEPAKGK